MNSLLDSQSILEGLRFLYRPPGKKRANSSLHVMSKKLHYKSPRLIEMIIKGDRIPSDDFLARTSDLFSLSDMERSFLELLVRKERVAAKGLSTEVWDRRIRELKKKVVSVRFIEPHFFTLFSDWHCLAIKQLLQSSSKSFTVAEIIKKLRNKISTAEAEKALHALLHLGFIKREEGAEAFISIDKESIYTRPDLPSNAVRKHHRQMMERAIEALEEQDIEEREMISLTFTCAPSSVKKIKTVLRKVRDEIDAEFCESVPSVYQLNMQFFAHTK